MPDTLITQTISTTDAQVLINCADNPLVSIEVSNTWAGALNIETNLDPDNPVWRAAKVFTEAGATASAAPTANGRWIIQAAGVGQVRARLNPATSGGPTVTLRAGDNETFGLSGGGGGGGGGGAVTVADGADIALGTTTDAGIITDVAGTVIGFLRGNIKLWLNFLARLPAALVGGRLDVNVGATGVIQPVSGTVTITPSGTQTVAGTVTANAGSGTFTAAGDVASGVNDSGNPVKIGHLAVAHGSAPTTVTAGQRANSLSTRAGIEFVAPGHPNSITTTVDFVGAQTNTVVVANSAGTKLVVTSYLFFASAANAVNITGAVGLAQTVTPASGVTGRLGAGTVAPSSGFGRKTYQSGADGDQLLVTSTGAGNFSVQVEYHAAPS